MPASSDPFADTGNHSGSAARNNGASAAMVAAHSVLPSLPPLDPFADGAPPMRSPTFSGRVSALSWAALLRFKGTILLIFLVGSGVSVGGIWLAMVPEYRAKATVEVLPANPRVLYRTEDNGVLPYHQQYLNSQPGVIRGVTVLRGVLAQPEVQETSWYRNPAKTLLGHVGSRLGELKDVLTVEPRPGTYLIDISMRARDPHDAEVIVNEVVEQYLTFAREKLRESDDAVYQRLVESKQSLEAEIAEHRSTATALQRELGAVTSADVIPRTKAWLDDRQAKLDELRREIATATWQEGELRALLEPKTRPGEQATSQPGDGRPQYQDDAEWRRLHIELKTVRHEIESNPRQLGQQHPDMLALVKKAELLEDLLQEQQARLDQQFRVYGGKPPVQSGVVSTPEAELAALGRKIGLLKKQEELLVADIQKRESDYERTFDNAKVLDREADALRYRAEKYDLVRRRIDEKETESGMFMSIRPVAAAFAPSEPDHDRRRLLTAVAILAALGAGLGVAYLRVLTSPSIHEVSDLTPTLQAPFLGNLPLLRHPGRPNERETVIQNECIRMVRTAVLQRLNGSPNRAVLITSAGPGVGKTGVACMLARSLAQLDQSVLLVEADWRNPAACRQLGLTPQRGLLDLLRTSNGVERSNGAPKGRKIVALEDEDVILHNAGTAGLHVMPAGQARDAVDAELLADGKLAAHLARWNKTYDVVLLDGSPVLPVADARILARQVGGTVMVVREGHCRRAEVVDALASLGVAGARMLGTVFIGAIRSSGYQHGYYGYAARGGTSAPALDVRTSH